MDESVFDRTPVPLEDLKKFEIRDRTYNRQFCNIYNTRLQALKNAIEAKAKQKWGRHKIVELSDLTSSEHGNELVIIIGTLYKHQELKPSILKDISDELQLNPQPSRSNYASDKDCLFLEDQVLRIKLVGNNIDPKYLVTGLVCAVLGRDNNDGTLWVEEYCMPGLCSKIIQTPSPPERAKILLLSGLDFANTADCLEYELLVEWICGMAGNVSSQRDVAALSYVIIAGNSVRGSVETYNRQGYSAAKNKDTAVGLEAALATHRFDNLLSQIVEACCVILMPGQFDPSNHSLPQQPFDPFILPKSSSYKSLRAVTNPWVGKIGSRVVAGSSGQPVEDILRVAGLAENPPIAWLGDTLSWRHFAPTAPDTLDAYPYFNSDPFVIDDCPDVYFVGNMEEYETKIITGDEGQLVTLICIPKFSKTHTGVIIDLESLATSLISFKATT